MSISGKDRGNPSIYFSPAGSGLDERTHIKHLPAGHYFGPLNSGNWCPAQSLSQAGQARAPGACSALVKPAKAILSRAEVTPHHHLSAWTPGALQGTAGGRSALPV